MVSWDWSGWSRQLCRVSVARSDIALESPIEDNFDWKFHVHDILCLVNIDILASLFKSWIQLLLGDWQLSLSTPCFVYLKCQSHISTLLHKFSQHTQPTYQNNKNNKLKIYIYIYFFYLVHMVENS